MSEEKTALATLVATRVADRVKIDLSIVSRALSCLAEGYPVPYLARYRRVDVGGLSEDELHSIRRAAEQVTELEKRREFVLRALQGRDDVPGKALKRISNARTRPELEYVYEPYRPHGRTSASIAREKGFAPLAESIAKGEMLEANDDAISGAINILAHQFAADSEARLAMFRTMEKTGEIRSSPGPGRKEFPPRYASLRNVTGRIAKIPAPRLLALLRGEADGALQLTIDAKDDKVEAVIRQRHYPTPAPLPAAEVLQLQGFLQRPMSNRSSKRLLRRLLLRLVRLPNQLRHPRAKSRRMFATSWTARSNSRCA